MRSSWKQQIMYIIAAISAASFLTTVGHAMENTGKTERAIFAGGCFWCVEAKYDEVKGVVSAVSGYTGGKQENPSYEQVSAGGTGHYEALEVTYNPDEISYRELLDIFWINIDPFDADGQFVDRGNQYRAAIFYLNDEQKKLAEETKAAKEKELGKEIVTEIVPAGKFYNAEDYHQDYYRENPVRYKFYTYGNGRQDRLKEVWGEKQK